MGSNQFTPDEIHEIALENSKFFTYERVYRNRSHGLLRSLTEAAVKTPLRTRTNINKYKPNSEKAEAAKMLKNAIQKAISLGEYQKLFTYHSQYMLEMHSLHQINYRFLPWHRIYLLKFEEMLNTVMKSQENPEPNISLPYWDWENDRQIPEFLRDLTPTMTVQVYFWDIPTMTFIRTEIDTLTVKRFPMDDGRGLPTKELVDEARAKKSYREFAYDPLETTIHGGVHNWVGGTNPNPDPGKPFDEAGALAYLEISPLDFCFWLHHANIDRIWASWQKKQEEAGNISHIYANLVGEEGIMTPWTDYTEPQTRQIQQLGYTYDKL